MNVDYGDMDIRLLVQRRKQESYKASCKREDLAYDEISETRLIVVSDGFVNFSQHFRYLGTWVSFSFRAVHDVANILVSANASMGAMYKIWDDNNVYTYSKYMLFRAIPCNLLLLG